MGRTRTEYALGEVFLKRNGVDLRRNFDFYPPQNGETVWFENLHAEPFVGRSSEGIRTTGVYVVQEAGEKKPRRFPFTQSISGFEEQGKGS
jgi:hypothetical protein